MKKYKTIKEFPDSPPVGTILYSTDEGYFYIESSRENFVYSKFGINNKEFFAPYLFTTEDGVDIYLGDTVWFTGVGNHVQEVKLLNETFATHTIKYFSTKEKAQEYLDSLQEFKVGDIVVHIGENCIMKIEGFAGDNEPLVRYTNGYGDQHSNYFLNNYCRKATDNEIISYYEKKGWVKGAKFRWDNQIWDFTYIGFKTSTGDPLIMFDANFGVKIEDCELIKEPTNVGGFAYLENGEIIIP